VNPPVPNPAHSLARMRVPRRPWPQRLRRRVLLALHNTTVQFLVVFVGFVVAGALAEELLEGGVAGSRFASFFQSLWFTVVTITTVGYGDMAPQTPLGQTWAVVEMFFGIGLVGVITGNVASFMVERNRRRALGLVPLRHLSGHTIVCGWSGELKEILLELFETVPGLEPADLVLVAAHSPTEVAALKRDRRLSGISFVAGSPTERTVLEQAQVATAARVIILAEVEGNASADAVDARTVLAANTVEALNPVVHTSTELLQPHYARYLRHARVEEVIPSEEDTRNLIVQASLGDGMANVFDRFVARDGRVIRTLPVELAWLGRPYADLCGHFAAQGVMVLGLLENTGNLHERKRDRLRRALRTAAYGQAVAGLREVRRLVSNVPRLNPPPDTPIADNTNVVLLMPHEEPQTAEEAERRRGQVPESRWPEQEHLLVCGWKPGMADLLARIQAVHAARGRPLRALTLVASPPPEETAAIAEHPELGALRLVTGQSTDPGVLRSAGIHTADRVLVLASPNVARTPEETDARAVMISIAVHDLNRRAYKCVELLDPSFADHLRVASVEEVVYTQRFRRAMLAHGSAGLGQAVAIRAMLDPLAARLRVVNFPPGPPELTVGQHAPRLRDEGMQLLGVIDHCGNLHARKDEFLYEAQIQPQIGDAVEHLLRLKLITSNEARLNPGVDYVTGNHTRAVVLTAEAAAAPRP